MAVIDQYTSKVLAQGQINSEATGAAFGAQVGAGLQNLGEGIADVGRAAAEQQARDETTKVHVAMAQARQQAQKILQDETNSTDPGDPEFTSRVVGKIGAYLGPLGEQFQSPTAKRLFTTMSADMVGTYGVDAVQEQSRLAGVAAKNEYTNLTNASSTIAAQDFSKAGSEVESVMRAIDDPNGKFANIPQTARDALKQTAKLEIELNAAKGFARRYPSAVLGSLDPTVRTQVQQVIANPPKPGVVPDLKASDVKPYTPQNIQSKAAQISAPTPYDKDFEDAARLYNLDPKELKLRAAVESGFNPTAVSGKNAGGIMQFTPEMATQLGVDRSDPKASIFAAAKLLANYRTQAGGDMSKVDMMYYGGAAGTAWGPNTKQYAANLSALRQAVGLGASAPPEAFAPTAPEQLTTQNQTGQAAVAGGPAPQPDWKKAKTGIAVIDNLPADKFFAVLTEAEHYQRAYDTQTERARMEAERVKKEAQSQAMNGYLTRIITPADEAPSPGEPEIMADKTLDWQQKQHLVDYKMRREREQAAGAESKTNPAEVRALMLQIHAADDDPAKAYNLDPVMESYKKGNISTNEMVFLRREVEQMRDGTTQGFQKDVNNARNAVYTALTRSILGQVQPEVAADAAYRFNADMERQISDLRKQNKDPRILLDPSSRDYLLRPERIQSFMPNGRTAAADGAAKVAQSQASSLPTYKDYDKLPKGASFTDPQGNVRVKGN